MTNYGLKRKKGFTLIETIISIVVIAIVIYAGFAIFITSSTKGVNVELYSISQSLAEGKLEEVMAADFLNVTSEAETNFTGDLSNYSYEIVVDYVEAGALDTPVGYQTDYKRIQSKIRHPELGNPIVLESIKVNY